MGHLFGKREPYRHTPSLFTCDRTRSCVAFTSFFLSWVADIQLNHNTCCSVLQCVAVCCSVLQCVAVCCSVLRCVAVCCSHLSFFLGWRISNVITGPGEWCSHYSVTQGLGHDSVAQEAAEREYEKTTSACTVCYYGVATISRLLTIQGLFCRIQSLL